MSVPLRKWILGLSVGSIVLLAGLVVYAPPDGVARAHLVLFVGRFHPLAVHLPIALLLLVPLLEVLALVRKRTELQQSAGFILGLASIAAIASAWLGWMLAWSGGYQGSLLVGHMWGGVTLAAGSLACWAAARWNQNVYRGGLLAMIALLIWTGDQGGQLTHGTTFLTEHMPGSSRRARDPEIDPASVYALRIQPIFQAKCLLCHSAQKFKGGLRLDSYRNLMRGGKDGPVIQAGEPLKSELFRRVSLPPEHKDFMPAEGKPALTAEERKVFEIWISAGATPQIAERDIEKLPASANAATVSEPVTDDYRPQLQTIRKLENSLGIHLVPRSQKATDGLVLRTASAPARCDDATLTQLAPVASLIVDAELARTRITDKGVDALLSFSNLRSLDLSHTAITSSGARKLARMNKLETINLTETRVAAGELTELQGKPGLKRLYVFGTH